MFDLSRKIVTYYNPQEELISESIDHFEVWFATPFGLISNINDAIARCVANDLNPAFTIQSKAVVITKSGYYEVLP